MLRRMLWRMYQLYGAFILWVLKPGLAPLIRELMDTDNDLKRRKVDWSQVFEDPQGFIKKQRMPKQE